MGIEKTSCMLWACHVTLWVCVQFLCDLSRYFWACPVPAGAAQVPGGWRGAERDQRAHGELSGPQGAAHPHLLPGGASEPPPGGRPDQGRQATPQTAAAEGQGSFIGSFVGVH